MQSNSPEKTFQKTYSFFDSSKINFKPVLQKERFFNALMKPKVMPDNNLNSITGSSYSDLSVFSSLPLYGESKSDSPDLKVMLKTNPYRRNCELSFIRNEKVNCL
jgi:hypothetical protein